jgi:hypothetical protein
MSLPSRDTFITPPRDSLLRILFASPQSSLTLPSFLFYHFAFFSCDLHPPPVSSHLFRPSLLLSLLTPVTILSPLPPPPLVLCHSCFLCPLSDVLARRPARLLLPGSCWAGTERFTAFLLPFLFWRAEEGGWRFGREPGSLIT